MAKKVPAVKKAPVVKTQKDLSNEKRLEILETHLLQAFQFLKEHFGADLKPALDAAIQEALVSVVKKA